MAGIFSISKFEEFARQVEFINSEFSRRNINIHPLSRYSKYFSCMRALAGAKVKSEFDSVIEEFGMPLILQSFLEGSEIYGVLRQFENENDQVFGHNLKKIISGPVIPDENETKTQSRDIMFELNMAAHFKKTNINCFLAEPDLKIKYKDYELLIACKRPQGLNNLEANIRKAKRQISKRGIGLIALSLDKIINPEARVLQGTNMENLAGSIRHEINKFRESYGFNISQWANDRKVIGTIYSLSLMGDIKSPNLFVSCQQFYIGLYCSNTSPYYFLLQEISNNFKQISQ